MVDFQSRDTSRGVDEDSNEDGPPEEGDREDAVENEGVADENGESEGLADEDERPTDTDGRRAGEDEADEAATTARADPESVGDVASSGVSVAILITDDESDGAADAVADALDGEHEVLGRDQRTGDLDAIQTAVNTFLDQPSVDAVVTVGGVGVGLTQVTVDAVEPLLDARLPGFGELFRRRYEGKVGSAALRTRAFAGVAGSTPVVALPADAAAARVATEELVVPELEELVAAAGES